MRAVVQRVLEASVLVEDQEVGRINEGLLIYLGVGSSDTEDDLLYVANKVVGLRIFQDENGHMNKSLVEVGGSALVISQFTLFGDVRRGKRPSFTSAMEPVEANLMYEAFIKKLKLQDINCEKGIFGAMMKVSSVNDGPVTILIDSQKLF